MSRGRVVGAAGVMFLSALTFQHCASQPASTPAAAATATPTAPSLDTALTPTLSVKEVMEHIVDPISDWVFDAAVVDISAKGVVETKPLTDEDWLKVERGGLILAEATNLLKMPRKMAPDSEIGKPHEKGEPELSPEQIQAKVDQDRALWYKYANGLRDVALDAVKVARARDVDSLFRVGSDIDRACENCHLEYWYPGDRKAVLEDQNKKVTYDPPKSTPKKK